MFVTRNSITYVVEPGCGFTDNPHYWKNVSEGMWEPETFDILQSFLTKQHSYLDVGAWVGSTVLFGAQLAKKCYALEPDPVAFAALLKNLSLNTGIINVEPKQVAVASTTGVLQMGSRITRGDSMSSFLWCNEAWSVPSSTLQDFFEKYKIEDCNFVKMDIEGAEAMVLFASKDFLRATHPTIYLSLHTPWMTDTADYFNQIIESISFYKKIYLTDRRLITLNDVPGLRGFDAIIATNE